MSSKMDIRTDEKTPLTTRKHIFKDIILTITTILICMAEGVELYLPGVISQDISCTLELSHTQTGLVECSIYMGSTVAGFTCNSIVRRFGCRLPLLASCYLSIFSTLISVFSGNFAALVAARIFIGLCVGVNLTTNGLFMSERLINTNLYEWMAFITSASFCVGAGWVALLAHLFLERVGWKYFLLITSIPLFIPPILIIHTVFSEPCAGPSTAAGNGIDTITTDSEIDKVPKRKDGSFLKSMATFSKLTYFAAVLSLAAELHAGSTVIFLPHLIKKYNTLQTLGNTTSENSCSTNIHGSQFLILAGVNFGAVMLGKITGYLLYTKVPFKYSLFIAGVFSATSYSVFLVTYKIEWVSMAFSIIKFVFGICSCQLRLLRHNAALFHEGELVRSCSFITAAAQVGLFMGTLFTGLTTPLVTTTVCLVASLTEFILGFVMKLEK